MLIHRWGYDKNNFISHLDLFILISKVAFVIYLKYVQLPPNRITEQVFQNIQLPPFRREPHIYCFLKKFTVEKTTDLSKISSKSMHKYFRLFRAVVSEIMVITMMNTKLLS